MKKLIPVSFVVLEEDDEETASTFFFRKVRGARAFVRYLGKFPEVDANTVRILPKVESSTIDADKAEVLPIEDSDGEEDMTDFEAKAYRLGAVCVIEK